VGTAGILRGVDPAHTTVPSTAVTVLMPPGAAAVAVGSENGTSHLSMVDLHTSVTVTGLNARP